MFAWPKLLVSTECLSHTLPHELAALSENTEQLIDFTAVQIKPDLEVAAMLHQRQSLRFSFCLFHRDRIEDVCAITTFGEATTDEVFACLLVSCIKHNCPFNEGNVIRNKKYHQLILNSIYGYDSDRRTKSKQEGN
jgi:hypothetical protein